MPWGLPVAGSQAASYTDVEGKPPGCFNASGWADSGKGKHRSLRVQVQIAIMLHCPKSRVLEGRGGDPRQVYSPCCGSLFICRIQPPSVARPRGGCCSEVGWLSASSGVLHKPLSSCTAPYTKHLSDVRTRPPSPEYLSAAQAVMDLPLQHSGGRRQLPSHFTDGKLSGRLSDLPMVTSEICDRGGT